MERGVQTLDMSGPGYAGSRLGPSQANWHSYSLRPSERDLPRNHQAGELAVTGPQFRIDTSRFIVSHLIGQPRVGEGYRKACCSTVPDMTLPLHRTAVLPLATLQRDPPVRVPPATAAPWPPCPPCHQGTGSRTPLRQRPAQPPAARLQASPRRWLGGLGREVCAARWLPKLQAAGRMHVLSALMAPACRTSSSVSWTGGRGARGQPQSGIVRKNEVY